MNPRSLTRKSKFLAAVWQWSRFSAAGLLLLTFPGSMQAQSVESPTQTPPVPIPLANPAKPATESQPTDAKQSKPVRGADRRRAAKLFLASTKLFEKEHFDEAMRGYLEAAALDPGNPDYALAAEVARSHAVTAFIQAAAKDRLRGDGAAMRAELARAHELDPKNAQVNEHLTEMGDEALLGQSSSIYAAGAATVGEAPKLEPAAEIHGFHTRTDQRQMIQQVFKAYGIEATVDESVRATQARLDLEDADFDSATKALGLLTMSFYAPVDAHRVIVARDTRENRQQFLRQELETIYLPGLASTELTDVGNMAKNIFDAQQAVVEPSSGTISIRAPDKTLQAFNATLRSLLDGHSQVLLDVRLIQVAHTSGRNTGALLPQSMSAFNLYAEEQKILNDNQALVQQIISSGLAAPGDTMAIIAILLASGQVSSSLFSGGLAIFGGGLTQSAFAPGPISVNLNLNSSDSRELDQIQLRLGDGEAGTLRTGTRYPIQTASYSSVVASLPKIAGLTSPGNSSGLAGTLANALDTSVPNIPQVEYQDLGLTLKATPKVMRNDEVALTVDMKIDALAGGSINGNPILNNRAYTGVVTLRKGESVVVVSELDQTESRAISGTPGVSEIPGLNDLTSKDTQKNFATLLIVMTPRVLRGPQATGHSAVMRVERGQSGR